MRNQKIEMPTTFPVTSHTDHVGKGSTFVAIKGLKEDGVLYIVDALLKGASTIVVQAHVHLAPDVLLALESAQAKLMRVDDPRKALAELSAAALDHPARKLKIVAITGTKGKTTSVFLLEHILRTAGHKTALLSTVKNKIGDLEFKTNLTTQHPDYLHVFFKLCVDAGVQYVVMETAAQAYSLYRTHGLEFDGFIFTNFAQEHAEFYDSMDDYFAAKCALAGQIKQDSPLIINNDDAAVVEHFKAQRNVLTFSFNDQLADFYAKLRGNTIDCLELLVTFSQNTLLFKCPSLVGTYNAYNILGVVALCIKLGLEPAEIARALMTFTCVPGRLERYTLPNGAHCFIDYAHNPSSYKAVLAMARNLTPHLVVVFGCGGERDKTKRPLMGAIAAEYADLVVLTSDNPRSEDAYEIIQDILQGIQDKNKVIIDIDRHAAIKKAYELSTADSVIMLLGKGPDEYQIIGNTKYYFSEAEIVKSL